MSNLSLSGRRTLRNGLNLAADVIAAGLDWLTIASAGRKRGVLSVRGGVTGDKEEVLEDAGQSLVGVRGRDK